MFKENQEKLFQKINNILKNIDYRKVKEDIGIELRKRNVDSAIIILASEIIMGNASVEQLVDDNGDTKLLFFFTDALNKALLKNDLDVNINLSEYFLKHEIDELEYFKFEKEKEKIYPIVFRNINMINDHHWEGTISAQELAKLNDAKVIIYNPNTQRNPKITKRGDKINVNPQKVLEIKKSLLEGTYEPDHIKLNILKNGNEKMIYNAKNRTLTVYEGSVINVVDGQHRKEANSLAVAENPDLDVVWGITIYNVSEIKAHAIMVQINKQTPMSEEWLSTKDYNKAENRVLGIMEDEKSNLFDIMKETDRHISNNQALVKKSNIALAIKEQYEDLLIDENGEQDNDNIRMIGRWLAEFFDYMIKLYSYDFKENPYEIKKSSFINWKNMFYGYVALSRALLNKDNWKELFKEKMQSIDFSMNNQMWQDMGMLNPKDANKTLRTNLYNLFKEGVE